MRRAHTLMELMVVMTLLMLFAVIAAPRLITGLGVARVDAAVDQARHDIAFARARAASTGLRHQLLLDPSTGEIAVLPFHADEANAPQTSQSRTDVALHDRLPDGVHVASWSVMPLGYAQAPASSTGAGQQASLLTLYPEGRSDGAILVVQDDAGRVRGITLDSFTGELRDLDPSEIDRLGIRSVRGSY